MTLQSQPSRLSCLIRRSVALAMLLYAATPMQAGIWPFAKKQVDEKAAASEAVRQEYLIAEKLFEQGEYSTAARTFKRLGKKYEGTTMGEDSTFMKAECEFQQQSYSYAHETYALLLKTYPTSRHLPTAIQRLYDIAYAWLEDSRLRAEGKPGKYNSFSRNVNFFDRTRPMFDTMGHAIRVIETIQQHDPIGPLTDDAVMMAAGHEFTTGDYIRAANYYEQVATDQPRSEHAAKALVLGAQSYMRSYLGPNYDGQDLDSAERLTKAALARSAELTPEQMERLERDLRVIYIEQAKRYFIIGEQYRNLRKPGSAHYYYQRVLEKYPDTDWARRAKDELDKLGPIAPVTPPPDDDAEPRRRIWPWTKDIDPKEADSKDTAPSRAPGAAPSREPAPPPTGTTPESARKRSKNETSDEPTEPAPLPSLSPSQRLFNTPTLPEN